MPNLVRRQRGHHPIQYPILRDPGTRLFYRERNITYSLSHASWQHYEIATSLGIPRRTILSSL